MNQQDSQSQPLTASIRGARKSLRTFSFAISALLINAITAPDVFAIQDGLERERQANAIVLQGSDQQKMNQALLKMQEVVAEKHAAIQQRLNDESGVWDSLLSAVGLSDLQLDELNKLKELKAYLPNLHQSASKDFDKIEAHLIEKGLPEEILARHHEASAQYRQQFELLSTRLNQLLAAKSLKGQSEALEALHEHMAPQKLKRTHQAVDPNNLPWGTPDASKTRKPAETAEELSQLTGIPNHPQATMVAANVITPDMLGKPGGPVAEDLAPTIDVQLTDAIRAKALELEDDPVRIYNWVRNTIEFIPSYGSIQGADYTLQSGKGNAFDTASLLIALLRAANIPARYAYGTIEVPAEKVMNWAGGVHVPEAAQQLLGQGGIPNIAMISGGKVSHIKMEHVWVEAWVDYFPSRAAKHLIGDSWIPLDASFKQYEFAEGQDWATSAPFDAEGLIDQISRNGTIDEAAGYIQGISQAAIDEALGGYKTQIETYINTRNSEATLGDVLGVQKVIVHEYQELAAGLPYRLVARTHNYSALPNGLRHKFRYTLGTAFYGSEDQRLITYERPLPEIAGKQLSLSFKPATDADEQIINSYLPEPDATTGQIDLSQMPPSLPGYLINLTAELSEGQSVVKEAASGAMGGELFETLALWSPNQGWKQAVNHPIVGEYRAVGLNYQGVSREQIRGLASSVKATREALESGDEVQIETLRKHQLIGDLLYGTILNYLALNDTQDQIQSRAADVVSYRLPSYGLFSSSLSPSYWFGVPRDVYFAGLVMDVDHLATQTVAKNNDHDLAVGFTKASGARASAMEHLVPEQMLSSEQAPAEGVSAVKALALAVAQGQKIWTIDQRNVDTALAAISLDPEIESDIRSAVRSGKVATTHEVPINFAGGTNVGYLLIDPQTGAGAYMIAGGNSGGFISSDMADGLGFLALAAGIIGGTASIIPLIVLGVLISVFLAIELYLDYRAIGGNCRDLELLVAGAVAAIIIGAFLAPITTIVLAYVALLAGNGASVAAGSAICQRPSEG